MSELYRLTASQALRLMNSNRLTVEQYAQSLLSRFRDRDPIVQAWAYFNPDLILDQARTLDQLPSQKRGPLHGVAVAVKYVIYTKGFGQFFFFFFFFLVLIFFFFVNFLLNFFFFI